MLRSPLVYERTSNALQFLALDPLYICVNLCNLWTYEYSKSELGIAGSAGEGDDVADVVHAGAELHDALEAQAEACVRDGSDPAQVAVPRIVPGVGG